MNILIKNSKLVDKEMEIVSDIYIENGKIKEIGENLQMDCEIIDGKGFTIMPAFVDLHTHFREPGRTDKEDLETGGRAALKGGYTLVNLMANTDPVASNMELVDYVLRRGEELDLVQLHQTVSLTKDFDGKTLSHLDLIDVEKVKFISDDGYGVISNKVSYDSMIKAKEKGFIIMTHAEDMDLTPIDYRISENIITFRDIYLSQVTGARVHFAHVSTEEAIKGIREAKSKGVNVTCEVTPHHIYMYNSDYKVNPPIREERDVSALIEAIKDGTVDAIATDHAPHTEEDKEEGAPGISGIETAFGICYTSLVKEGHIDLKKLSEIMSTNGAEIMGANKGRLKVGYDGDLVLVNLEDKYKIDSKKFQSKGKNTPLDGIEVYGEVAMTVKAGDIKYINDKYSELR